METSAKHSVDLSIVIVNYFSSDLINQAISSIVSKTHAITYEIIVVDNSRDEQGRQKIIKKFPSVHWIDMRYNAGFARANNTGMKAASGSAFLLLNPDTLVIDDSIERCYQKLTTSAYVAAGVQLLDENRQPQISGSHF